MFRTRERKRGLERERGAAQKLRSDDKRRREEGQRREEQDDRRMRRCTIRALILSLSPLSLVESSQSVPDFLFLKGPSFYKYFRFMPENFIYLFVSH